MLLSYRARLRRDLVRWQAEGIVDAAQAGRIAAASLRPPGLGPLRAALALCLVLLAAPSVIAFVAANWVGMAPPARLLVLGLANAAAVLAAYLAARRDARAPVPAARNLADAAATLSLAIAAGAIALVAQTFHLPPDPRGFAGTVAILGLATALVARSGGAAFVACIALLVADTEFAGATLAGLAPDRGGTPWQGFWLVLPAFGLGCLSGRLPARTATLFLLLAALANHGGGVTLGPAPDRIFLVALLALVPADALARLSGDGSAQRLREGGEALAAAAAGLCVVGVLAVAVRMLGLRGAEPGPAAPLALAALALGAALALRPRLSGRGPLPLCGSATLGAVGLALASWCVVAGTDPSARQGGSAFWTVWGGILPALGLVVAGHLDERRGLFNAALALTAGLTLAMLAVSRDLIGFSGNLLGCAVLVALTLAVCRWADRHPRARTT